MRYVRQGETGGRLAGQELLRELYKELGVGVPTAEIQHPVWANVFFSSRALIAGLMKQGISEDDIGSFVKGLGQAHKALVLVDVASKKDADDKIRGWFLILFTVSAHA